MNKKVFWIVETFLALLAISIFLIAVMPLNFTGSHVIDGYNITFTDKCGTKEAIAQQNYTACAGWANTDYFHKGFYNETFIVSNRSILEQYKTCLHEKKHFEITIPFDEEENYIQSITDKKIIPDYDETCLQAMIKAILGIR